MMRVCLVGTSNAIYKDGYAAAIEKSDRVSSFTKLSIGASPSVIIPYFLSEVDFREFDIVIFDTAINDRNYYINQSIRKEQIREFLEWGIQNAAQAGCRVGLLLMPTRTAFHKETISGLIYTKLAKETGALLFDGFEDARQVAEFIGCPLDTLFIDDFHYLKPFAWRLGRDVINALLDTKQIPVISKKLPEFYKIHLAGLPEQTAIVRKTSIIQRSFVRLEVGTQIEVPLRPGDSIVGVSINAAHCTGSLKITGKTEHVKNLTTQFSGSGKSMQLIVLPFTTTNICGEDGTVALSMALADDTVTESGRFDRAQQHPATLSAGLEIEDIIVRRSA